MPDHTDYINLNLLIFDDQNVERRSWSCLGQTCSRSLIVFLSQFFVKPLKICGCFWRIHLTKTCDESTVWVGVLCCRIHFTFTKFMNELNSTKNRNFIPLVGPSESGKTYVIHEWLKVQTFQPKFDKYCFSYQHPQPLYDVLRKEVDNIEFVQGVHFEFNNSLKKKGTKYLLIFDDSCAEICNSKEFVDIATADRHRGFSTINIKHNLFHQSKLGRDVELQNTHIIFSKSPRNVHQNATLSLQLGLGSTFVDWYREATSVPFDHLLIDLSPRTDDRLRYCTNSGNIPSKLYVPIKLKHLKNLDIEHPKSLYSPSIPALFLRMQNSVSKKLSKRFYPISQRVHRQPAARRLVRSNKKSCPKVQRRNSRTIFKNITLEASQESPFIAKRNIVHKHDFPPFVSNHLS